MIKGKSLVIGSVVAAFLVLGGGSNALAAERGSAVERSLQAKVERQVMRMENEFKLPIESVRCRHHRAEDDRNYSPVLKAFKCRIRYSFGSDHWEWNYAESSGSIPWGQSQYSPWYNGDWLVDCRQTETRGFCAKLGKRQMKACLDVPVKDMRGYCHRMVFGYVDPKTGKPPRGADPQIVSTKATAGDLGQVVGSGGCYPRDGIMPPCAPDIPVEVGAGPFTTRRDARVLSFGEVVVRGEELEPGISGRAEVKVQLKLDGVPIGAPKTVGVIGGATVTVPFEKRFFLAEGVHEVSVEITGSGYDHVNVVGESARLKVFAARIRQR